MSKHATKKQLDRMQHLLRLRPRTVAELLKEFNGPCLHIIKKLDETEPVLTTQVWDQSNPGWRFKYWIRPKRMGKNWKRIYATLQVPASYDVRVSDFGVSSVDFEVE